VDDREGEEEDGQRQPEVDGAPRHLGVDRLDPELLTCCQYQQEGNEI
jgi:hypothetical protein